MKESTNNVIKEMMKYSPEVVGYYDEIVKAFSLLKETFEKGKRVYVCGNGGSASDSEHIVGELVKAFRKHRPISNKFSEKFKSTYPSDDELLASYQGGLPAYSLVSETGIASAVLNDIGGEYVFSQQVYTYLNEGDTLVCLSTSGNSKNVVNAAKTAKIKGGKVLSFTGKKESKLSEISDVTLKANQDETYLVQQTHLPLYHILCAALEEEFF